MNVQIRIRTDVDFQDIVFISEYLDLATQGFAFCHNKPDNRHYHIYLFDINKSDDAIRKHIAKYLKDKSKYSVSTTAGGNKRLKLDPMTAFQYASKPSSNPELMWSKGYSEEEIQAFKDNARVYYEPVQAVLITKEDHYIVRPDKVWERLFANKEKYRNKSMKEIKSSICVEWLNNGKAIPRPSDLHRYALSLHTLLRFRDSEEIPEDALIGEFS